jgi:uncharacterized protein
METHTGSDPQRAPIPPGWPGDDPTMPEELATLGRHATPPRRRPVERVDDVEPEPDHGLDAGRADDRAAHEHDAGVHAAGGDDAGVHAADVHEAHVDDAGGDDADDDLDDDLIAGVQPAGRVLVVMVVALVLAMLVNADALVARAEGQAPGAERDRSLAIWHAVQDVSHALQLHRVRDLAETAVGDDEDEGADSDADGEPPAPAGSEGTPGTTEPGRPAGAGDDGDAGDAAARTDTAVPSLRTPTADDPLRVWIGGDSMAELFGQSLADRATATGLVDPTVHYEMASGLTRPDYYDWPRALESDVDESDPDVVVAVFGVNDAQGIVLPDGTPIPDVADPRWSREYRRRVGELMDQLRADGRIVVWVTQPPMREPGYGGRIAIVNQAVVAEAATRPWIVVVDPAPVIGDAAGAYAQALPDAAGASVEVRRGDGIHLTTAGGERLAAHVLTVIEQHYGTREAAG